MIELAGSADEFVHTAGQSAKLRKPRIAALLGPCDERCVCDGNVITAVGCGAACELGLKIVEKLCGSEKAESIKNGILA